MLPTAVVSRLARHLQPKLQTIVPARHPLEPRMQAKALATLLLSPALLWSGGAKAMPLIQEMALHSMLESTTSVFTVLRDYAILNPQGESDGSGGINGSPIVWNGSFGNAGWAYDASGFFSGLALTLHYTGVLSGSNATDVVVTIAGTGMLGNQPLLMSGASTWYFDSAAQDYLAMDFDQGTKIEANSFYKRVKGKETIICMLDGQVVGNGQVPPVIAGPPVELMSVASSGKKSAYPTSNIYGSGTKECHLAPLVLTSEASSGKRGLATVSTTIVSLFSTTSLPALEFPAAVAAGHEFDPSNLGTVVATDGGLYADDARNQFRSTGDYLDNGTFTGTTISVPEPTGLWLMGVALLSLILSCRLRGIAVMGRRLSAQPPAHPTTA